MRAAIALLHRRRDPDAGDPLDHRDLQRPLRGPARRRRRAADAISAWVVLDALRAGCAPTEAATPRFTIFPRRARPDRSSCRSSTSGRRSRGGDRRRARTPTFPLKDVELVVVDDGSTDGTRACCAKASLAGRTCASSITTATAARARRSGPRSSTRRASTRRSWTPTSSTTRRTSAAARAADRRARREAVFGTRAFEAHTAYSFWYVVGNKGVTLRRATSSTTAGSRTS